MKLLTELKKSIKLINGIRNFGEIKVISGITFEGKNFAIYEANKEFVYKEYNERTSSIRTIYTNGFETNVYVGKKPDQL